MSDTLLNLASEVSADIIYVTNLFCAWRDVSDTLIGFGSVVINTLLGLASKVNNTILSCWSDVSDTLFGLASEVSDT